jgi:2-methylcitrate dehydratase PrpD
MAHTDVLSAVDAGSASPARDGARTMTEQLADFVTRTRYADLPPQVIAKAKEQITFFFGRAFEGARSAEADQARRVFARARRPDGVSVIGHSLRLGLADAAAANCSLMRGAGGRDDVLWPAGIHAGVVTLPTALALAESEHASGRDLLLAVVIGYEVMGKLGRAAEAWSTRLPRRPTNIYGPFGPVAAAGRLLRLSPQRLAHAFGYAANIGIGIPEGGMADHYYSLINRNAILAVELAAAGGIAYSNETIEGSAGLYRSFFGVVPHALPGLMSRLGQDWEILGAEQKRYPGTGQNTVALDLLLRLAADEHLTPAQIDRIDVVEPDARDAEIRRREVQFQGPFERSVQAYSSLPYAIAVALVDGRVNLSRYPDDDDLSLINDPDVAVLMRRIHLTFEEGHASPRYASIVVRLKDGRHFRRDATTFAFAFPPDAWGPHLREFGSALLPEAQLVELEAGLRTLEGVPDVANLVQTATPPPAEAHS